ncbi:MAG: hypothetical protein ACK4NV_20935, partial [Pannonibacter sp.]
FNLGTQGASRPATAMARKPSPAAAASKVSSLAPAAPAQAAKPAARTVARAAPDRAPAPASPKSRPAPSPANALHGKLTAAFGGSSAAAKPSTENWEEF